MSGITNLDIHDISRTAKTYNIKTFFVIHPNERQKMIFDRIISFWKTEMAAFFNQHRVDALSVINFTIASNRSRKEGAGWQQETAYFDCAAYGKTAAVADVTDQRGIIDALAAGSQQQRVVDDSDAAGRPVDEIDHGAGDIMYVVVFDQDAAVSVP